jgi:two-component system chemotaxis response regulator CheY
MTKTPLEPAAAGFRCVVADDSAFARRFLAGIVTALGGTVVAEAASGEEAVELCARLRPELVLLDITMPELDGVEALRRIRAADPGARVVIVSALGHQEIVWKTVRIGAAHFITKPFSAQRAASVIRGVLAQGAERAS